MHSEKRPISLKNAKGIALLFGKNQYIRKKPILRKKVKGKALLSG